MKRSLLLLLAFALSAAFPLSSRSQSVLDNLIEGEGSEAPNDTTPPQRVGIPPVPEPGDGEAQTEGLELSANETGSVTGFCFDEYLIAARRVTPFRHVLAGKNDATVRTADGRTLPLQEAIDKGMVAVNDFQLKMMFTNRTNAPLSIRIARPVVFWNRPAGDVNPAALAALESPNDDYDWRQEQVWRITTAERRLAVLGYYDGSVWNIDRGRFGSAVSAFQRANNIASSGSLDNATIGRLATIDDNLRNRLRALGFRDREGRSLKEDLAAQIRAYQKYLGNPATGRWSPELGSRLGTDEQIIPQLNALRPNGKTIAEVLSESRPNVLTYLNGMKGMMVLMQTPQGVELWGRRGGSYQFQSRDLQAVRGMDEAAAALALRATKDDRIVIYPRVGGSDEVILNIGAQSVTTDAKSMAAYLNGGTVPASLDEAITKMIPSGSTTVTGGRLPAKLIVYRGPFVQGRSGADGSSLLGRLKLDQIDGAKLATALDRSYGDRASLYLSDDLRLNARSIRSSNDQGSIDVMLGHSRLFAEAVMSR
jgi:peptidoglycan hydrolase-like protein with peptidoglycan-binding domain